MNDPLLMEFMRVMAEFAAEMLRWNSRESTIAYRDIVEFQRRLPLTPIMGTKTVAKPKKKPVRND